ncbi:inositol 2-dehydrogenase [Bartonella sp. HY329]|uniref:inositol 2-dehydrogenase n=1 Tax=unclassified Bartonella TaxID=2645622 RepID=UPI0021C7CE91|nr:MULTISPECIES: inositol 2-dehydrogenase [unclassified Bartonella]UXM94422.1 inositol 2-dehydrogenase [Bartonella sp. HY329]UXN08746.1 inositol 2-dehydrogenase [Bartonella sp. HY328]
MFTMALLGCGRIGKMHADTIHRSDKCELAAVFDNYKPAAEALAKKYNCLCATSVEEAIAAADGVLIATSTPTHADFIELAVKAGKAIFCEKPIDLSLERVKQTRARIGDKADFIHIGFQRRFDPTIQGAHRAMLNGEVGEVQQVIITTRDAFAPPPYDYIKSSGGIFRDMTIHDFDLARYFLQEDPVEVFALGSVLIDKAIGEECHDFDNVMVILRTASGKQCHINNSRAAAYGYDQRVELQGSSGMLICENVPKNHVRRYNKLETEAASPFLDFFIDRYHEAYPGGLNSFVQHAIDKTPPEVTFTDGEKALALAEAAVKSVQEQRIVKVAY